MLSGLCRPRGHSLVTSGLCRGLVALKTATVTLTGLVMELLWRLKVWIVNVMVGNGLAKVLNSLYGKSFVNFLWCKLISVRKVCGWLIEYLCLLQIFSISTPHICVCLSRRLGECWRLWRRRCLKRREWTQRPRALSIWRNKIWKTKPRKEKIWSKTRRR